MPVSLFPTGTILAYTGSSIPTGYALCNGSNGTPNLTGRIILGAGSTYAQGTSGGSTTVGSAWTGSVTGAPVIQPYTLTSSHLPVHWHHGFRNQSVSSG